MKKILSTVTLFVAAALFVMIFCTSGTVQGQGDDCPTKLQNCLNKAYNAYKKCKEDGEEFACYVEYEGDQSDCESEHGDCNDDS